MFYRALVPPEIFVDVVLIWLPFPEIWALKSSRARKTGLTVLFLSGCLALMSNCARLASYWRHTINGAVPSVENAIVGWCNSEMSVCFIVACIPAMHPLFQRVVPSTVRNEAKRRFGFGRHRQSTNPVASSGSEGGFHRLVDSNGGSQSPAFARQVGSFGAKATHSGDISGIEAAKGNNGEETINLSEIEHGQGVLVQTEIMVYTQEEFIEDVLGF